MKTLSFGVELEVVAISKANAAQAIQSVVGGTIAHGMNGSCQVIATDGRTWNVVHDGSLSGPSSQNAEVVSPILRFVDIEKLQEVVRALRRANAKTSPSAGIHIHCSIEDFSVQGLRNLTKSYAKNEALIDRIFKVDPARKARYCKPMNQEVLKRIEKKLDSMRSLNEAWYGYFNERPERYNVSRYHGLNLHGAFLRGAVEWRIFNSDLHAGRVKAMIHFVLAFCAKARDAKASSSKPKPFNPSTARYDARVLAISLGLNGPLFQNTRKHLIDHLDGCSAWKHGRPESRRDAA